MYGVVGTMSGYSGEISCSEGSVIVQIDSLSAQISIALHSNRVEILSALQQFTVCIELMMHLKSSAVVRVLLDSSAFCTPTQSYCQVNSHVSLIVCAF